MKKLFAAAALISLIIVAACSGESTEERETKKTPDVIAREKVKEKPPVDPMSNKGIGPVKEVKLDAEINQSMALEGEELFKQYCAACHKTDKQYIGPPPKDILERRTPEWVMNMIMNPTEMLKEDPIAKELLAAANGAVMADQNITEEQARKILEYFRTIE